MSEARIQSQIIKNLERGGWLVVKIIQSTKNGWPDLQAVRYGKGYWREARPITTTQAQATKSSRRNGLRY